MVWSGQVSRSQGLKVSRSQGLKVSRSQGLKVSRSQGLKLSRSQVLKFLRSSHAVGKMIIGNHDEEVAGNIWSFTVFVLEDRAYQLQQR